MNGLGVDRQIMHFIKSAYTNYINGEKQGNCDRRNLSHSEFLEISEEKGDCRSLLWMFVIKDERADYLKDCLTGSPFFMPV